jgi:hypothetical protein
LHSGSSCQAKLITKCENPNPAILQAPANLLAFACSSFCCCKSLEKENIYIQVLHAKLIITSMCKPPNPAAIRASAATNLFNIRIQVLARQAHHHECVQTTKPSSNASKLLLLQISWTPAFLSSDMSRLPVSRASVEVLTPRKPN